MSKGESSQDSEAMKELDQVFLTVLDDIVQMVVHSASSAAEKMLEVSGQFLTETTHESLKDFHNLYFGNVEGELKSASREINAEVDQMVSSLQSMMEEGEDISEKSLSESSDASSKRLSLAGLQKKLEKIITVDSDIRKNLLPVISSMQFEEMLHNRLIHVSQAWNAALTTYSSDDPKINSEIISQSIAGLLASQGEREMYYKFVLNLEAPKGLEENVGFLDMLADESNK